MVLMNKEVLRFGVIGCGKVFNAAHIHAYLDLDGVELVGFYDVDPEHAVRTKAHFERLLDDRIAQVQQGNQSSSPDDAGSSYIEDAERYKTNKAHLRIFHTAEELLGNVDVVDICTPVKFHVPYSVMALEHGVNAMSEKPPARNWLETRQLMDAARNSQALYQLNDDNLFLPRYQMVRHVIESGEIGEVVSIWIARGSHGPQERAWFWDPQIAGGGALMDYGTHAVTSTWYLVGMDKVPRLVKSFRVSKRHAHRIIAGRVCEIGIDDDAHFKVCFEDPTTRDWQTVVIEATWSWPELGELGSDVAGYLEVRGTDGAILGYVNEKGQNCLRISRYGCGEHVLLVPPTRSERESFLAEIRNFVECIRAHKVSVLNEGVASEVAAVLGAVYLSELRGRIPVAIDEYKRFCLEELERTGNVETSVMSIIEKLTQSYRGSGDIFSHR